MNRLYLLIWAIGAALIFRIIMHFVDKNRIKDEVESKGGRVISISWNPFARGWFFEKMSAITTSLTWIVLGPLYRRLAKPVCSRGSIGRKDLVWTSLRRGLLRVIIVQNAAMRSTPSGAPVLTAAKRQNSRDRVPRSRCSSHDRVAL